MKKIIITICLCLMTASTAFGSLDDVKEFEFKIPVDTLLFMEWALTTDKTTIKGKPTYAQIKMFQKDTNMSESPEINRGRLNYVDVTCSTEKKPKTCKITHEVADGKNQRDFISVKAERELTLSQVNDLLEVARPVIDAFRSKASDRFKYSKIHNGKKYTCLYNKFWGFIGDGPYYTRYCRSKEFISQSSINSEIYKHTFGRALNPSKENSLENTPVNNASSVHLMLETRPRYDYKNRKSFNKSIGIR